MTAFLWVIILSVIFFANERQHLSNRLFRLSIILSLVGLMGVMFFHPAFTHSYTIIGIATVMLYGLIWGFYAIAVKVAFRGIDSRIGFSVVSIYTVIALFILTMFMGQPGKCLEMPFNGWFAVIISGVTGIALGHVFYYISLRRLGATTPSLVQLAQPFIVVVISYFVFSEKLSVPQLVFGVVLVAGSAMAILVQKRRCDVINLTRLPHLIEIAVVFRLAVVAVVSVRLGNVCVYSDSLDMLGFFGVTIHRN